MATNNNNGSNGNINYSSPASRNMGVTGNLQNRIEGKGFQERFYRETSGYLDSTANEIETILKGYKEIAKNVDSMSKVEQNRFKKQQEALEEQLKTLKYVKETREIDLEEAIKLIKESNKITVSGAKEHLRITRMIHEEQGLNDKKHREELDSIIEHYEKIKKTTSETNQDMKDTAKILANTSASFSKSMANSLNELGDKISNISNMLNLSSIANNAAEQNLRSRLSIQNSVKKQLGLSTSTEYNQFRQSAMKTLQDMNKSMGNLFSADDAYKYFEKLGDLGIANKQLAEEQMKAAVIGSKYLGVSTETQTSILKFMKLTDNHTALSNHNKTIVALLRADLGVNREQLDALTQMAANDQDALMASGMSADTYAKYLDQYTTVGAVLSSKYGESTSKAMMNAISELARASYEDSEKLIANYGLDAVGAARYLKNSGDVMGTLERLMNSSAGWGSSFSNDNMANSTWQSTIGMTSQGAVLGFSRLQNDWSEVSGTTNDILNGIKSMSDLDVESYVQENTELSMLEKIENWSSFIKDEIESWNMTGILNLANLALVAYLAAKPFEIVSFLKGLKLPGFLSSTTAKSAETASTLSGLSSGILAVGGGIALGLGAANIIASAIDAANNKTLSSNISAGAEELKGTTLENNKTAASLVGIGNTYGNNGTNQSNKFGSAFGTTVKGIGVGLLGLTRDLSQINQDDYYFFTRKMNMRPANAEDVQAYNLAWALLLMSAKRQADVPELASYTTDDIAAILQYKGWSKEYLDRVAADAKPHPNKSKDEDQDYIDWSYLNIDGYKKAGLSYVPKDNYRALLHKGEMILNERQAQAYRDGYGMGGEDDSLKAMIKSPWIRISSMWGSRKNPFGGNGNENHGGMDIAAPANTPVGSPVSGTVYTTTTGYGGGFGNSVYISGKNGMNYILAHFVKPASVSTGATVNPGQVVGYVGSTGRSTGNHLHFQVNKSGTWNKANTVNPVPYLNTGVLYPGTAIESVSADMTSNGASLAVTTPSTRRFINGSSNATYSNYMGGEDDGATKIVSSVDGGFNKLIAYLDNISRRQDEQQILLEAFSKSRSSGRDL